MGNTPLRTPLHDAHVRLKARMVDFHGWRMPVQYSGIVEEHSAVRSRAGVFDISHMGRVRIVGPARRPFLQRLLTINVDGVPPGRCRYAFMLTEKGTIIDDLLYYAGTEHDILVINASNREKDLAWMRRHQPSSVRLEDLTFTTSLLAVQGPGSPAAVRKSLGIDPSPLRYYSYATFGDILVSRTGYTGEDGFEILLPADAAAGAWEKILAAGVTPAGLGARDTLRTEAGMPLYGNDIDDTTTPLEAGLAFAVELEKGDFIGRDTLVAAGDPARLLSGMVLDSSRIARPGCEVRLEGRSIGAVTSGTWSPTLRKSIAMAYLPVPARRPGAPLEIDVRGKVEKARVANLPFYRREKP